MDQHRHIGILNHTPLVIYSCVDSFVPLERNLADLIAVVANRPFTLVLQIWQSWERLAVDQPDLLEAIAQSARRHSEANPGNRLWFACNTEAEVAIARARGLRARYLSQHAFIDDTVFRVMPGEPKRFAAVYVGQMWDRKRHELAALVDPICLIFGLHLGQAALERLAQVKSFMPHAYLANGDPLAPGGQYRYLTPSESCALFNQSRVGLCLSAHEGASLSVAEYLLSGLPVVSTRSKGGRDIFFNDRVAIICDDTPAAVNDAVRRMIKRGPARGEVRRHVLEQLWGMRGSWRQFVGRECGALGNGDGNRFAENFATIRGFWCGMPIKSVAALGRVLQDGTGWV